MPSNTPRKCALICCLVTSAASLPGPSFNTTSDDGLGPALTADVVGVFYKNGWYKCLDLPGGNTGNGNKVQIWDCNGLNNQKWIFAPGSWRIVYASDPSKCLDVPGGNFNNGNQLQIWDCNGQPGQVWGYDSNMGTIYLAKSATDASKCMDLAGGNSKNGGKVEVWDCNGRNNQQWSFSPPSPGPPSPPSPPSPGPTPGHTDLTLSWPEGGGHGACNGPAVQGSSVIQTHGNDITITTDAAPSGSCVYRNAHPSINLDEYSHVEVDLETTGNHAAYGQKGGMWFSFWMYPPSYAYKHGIQESGEVDFVENSNSVRTNFAGCRHDCHETSWGESANNVRAHITMFYDKTQETVNVYRCSHGSNSCGTSGERAYIDLRKMQVQKPYMYTFSADVWYAKPGFNFKFSVTNLRIIRSSMTSNAFVYEVII